MVAGDSAVWVWTLTGTNMARAALKAWFVSGFRRPGDLKGCGAVVRRQQPPGDPVVAVAMARHREAMLIAIITSGA